MTERKITSIPRERVAEEEVWTAFPIVKKPKAKHMPVAVDEMMNSISIEKKPEAKSVLVALDEKKKSIHTEEKPKATTYVPGLGKPLREPRNEERIEQHEKPIILRYSEHALRDYNEKHGTDLMLLNLLKYEVHWGYPAHTVDFKEMYRKWIHINLEARHVHSEKPLLLFAELYMEEYDEPVLTRLSLLPPIDNLHGINPRPCTIRVPFHRFRAGFDDNCRVSEEATTGARMEKQETRLAEFALMDYNNKNGTRLEFVRDARCHMFPGTGLSMDFKEKETIWTHMNLFAKRPKHAVCCDEYEEVLLFAELYVGDHNENVLATLSVVDQEDNGAKCIFCPASILHPGFDCFH